MRVEFPLVAAALAASAAAPPPPTLSASAAPTSSAAWPQYTPVPGKSGYFFSLGNHRFRIGLPNTTHEVARLPKKHSRQSAKRVTAAATTAAATAVGVNVTWRRADLDPLQKAVFVQTANGTTVDCTYDPNTATSHEATFQISPVAGEADYYLYYMPFTTCEYSGGACEYGAQSVYAVPGVEGSCVPSTSSRVHGAGVVYDATDANVQYEARAPFQTFDPMEFPMTPTERDAFVASHTAAAHSSSSSSKSPQHPSDMDSELVRDGCAESVIVVAEHHDFPVKMTSAMPSRWLITAPDTPGIELTCLAGAHLAFQAAVVNVGNGGAGAANVTVHQTVFSDFVSAAGASIPSSAARCMNSEGVDFWGRNVSWTLPGIPGGDGVLPLWLALVVPSDVAPGTYAGSLNVSVSCGADAGVQQVQVNITVLPGSPVPFGGDDNISSGSRLHWFDSRLGLGNTAPLPSPYAFAFNLCVWFQSRSTCEDTHRCWLCNLVSAPGTLQSRQMPARPL